MDALSWAEPMAWEWGEAAGQPVAEAGSSRTKPLALSEGSLARGGAQAAKNRQSGVSEGKIAQRAQFRGEAADCDSEAADFAPSGSSSSPERFEAQRLALGKPKSVLRVRRYCYQPGDETQERYGFA